MKNSVVIRTDMHNIMETPAHVRVVINGLQFIGEWSWDGDCWKTSVTAWASINAAMECAKRSAFIDFIVIKRKERIAKSS